MKGKGPKLERETIINFNEAEPYASIWTASETFEVPKKLVSVRKPRKISDAQRTTLAEKARSMRSGTVITESEAADDPQE